jgi:hypothetical protein
MSKLSHGFYRALLPPSPASASVKLSATVATRLLALGIDITDLRRFLGHQIYAETTAVTLQRKLERPPTRWSAASGRVERTRRRCSRRTCWHDAGRSGSALLVHEVAMLAAAQACVHCASRERPPLCALSRLASLPEPPLPNGAPKF